MTTGKEMVEEGQYLPEVSPRDVVEKATEQATVLMDIVEKRKIYQQIGAKKYLQVEAWEVIGAFNSVSAITDKVYPLERDGELVGYEAEVSLWKRGERVGGATMSCGLDEFPCRGKEGEAKHKAAKSSAQTWATSKAYRMNYSWVAVLAGFEPTPAEEMYEDKKAEHKLKAKAETKTEEQGEHMCPIHKVPFVKTAKMKGYAHAIKGTSPTVWCNEDDLDKDAIDAEVVKEKPDEPVEDASPIDIVWLKESLEQLKWNTCGKWLKDKFGVTGTRVSEQVKQLTPDQAKEFEKEVKDRLEMAIPY